MNLFPTDREIIRRGRHFGAWKNPDGTQGQRIYARPIHRLSGEQWTEMDNQILAPWKFQVDGKALDFALGKLQAKTTGGAVRDLSLADTVTVSGSGDKMTCYPYPGVEIDYEVGMAGVKETIRINSLPVLPGGSFKPKWVTISGQVAGSSGQGLQRKDATFMDAKGAEGSGYLTWLGDNFELGIDLAWLYAAPLPVVIDPTISAEGNDCTFYGSLTLNEADREYFKLPTKYDVTSIPDDAIFSAATSNLYLGVKGTNKTFASKRFQSQTWVETSSFATLNAIGMGASLGSYTITGLTLSAYNAFNVLKGDNTDGIELDVSTGNQYFSSVLHFTPAFTTQNGTANNTTNRYGPYTFSLFNSAEGTNVPYLDVTYTTPAAGGFAVII